MCQFRKNKFENKKLFGNNKTFWNVFLCLQTPSIWVHFFRQLQNLLHVSTLKTYQVLILIIVLFITILLAKLMCPNHYKLRQKVTRGRKLFLGMSAKLDGRPRQRKEDRRSLSRALTNFYNKWTYIREF